MKTNARGIALIKLHEELRLQAYQDPKGIWTIGYGSTRNVAPGMRITAETAELLLAQDLKGAETLVGRYVTVPLSSNEFSALVSFTFNCGGGALLCSTVLKELNRGNRAAAADAFLMWDKIRLPDGSMRVLPELARRRRDERDLFLSP